MATGARTPTNSTASGGGGKIDSRLRFLMKRIEAAKVVDPAAPRRGEAAERVYFGATVRYADEAGAEHVVCIVGADEVDLERRHVSWTSPLGRALMKAAEGDVDVGSYRDLLRGDCGGAVPGAGRGGGEEALGLAADRSPTGFPASGGEALAPDAAEGSMGVIEEDPRSAGWRISIF